MEELYALYLHLYVLDSTDNPSGFKEVLDEVTHLNEDDADEEGVPVAKRIEVLAVAAIAATDWEGATVGDEIAGALLDFYEFQQVWQKYRNLEPRK